MKTLAQIKEMYKSDTLDGRDLLRLTAFYPAEDLESFGLTLKEGAVHEPKEFTRENVLAQLEKDVAFGFEKALDKRGLSSGMMYSVVMMWNWILEEGLEEWDAKSNYVMYGLPLFKATALKYGWNNPIGNDSGSEEKYNS